MQNSPVIIDLKFDRQQVASALAGRFTGREVVNLAHPSSKGRDLSGIDYAVVWRPSADLFDRAKDLKVVFSGGAGVDHVLTLPGLPDIPLVRFVDRSLTTRMSEWVVMQCLMHLRQVTAYEALRRQRVWRELPQPEAREVTVGIMGLGVLGEDSAQKLAMLGFDVLGIFDRGIFSSLKRNGALGAPVFVNAGRGGSQVEADILAALDDGTLGGASLDVFEQEPLPLESPLWTHEKVLFTPHAAAASDVRALFAHVEAQIERFEAGKPLEHLVDRQAGY